MDENVVNCRDWFKWTETSCWFFYFWIW